MKTLHEIVEEIKANKKPDYEELRYAVLALVRVANTETSNLFQLCTRMNKNDKRQALKAIEYYRTVLKEIPKKAIGWDYDPENTEYQKIHGKLKNNLEVLEKCLEAHLWLEED